jgi:hypothetical protein
MQTKPKTPVVALTVRLNAAQYAALHEHAERLGIPVSNVVRLALKAFCPAPANPKKAARPAAS